MSLFVLAALANAADVEELYHAALENDADVVRILLEHGADPNVQNRQGDTPLICAAKYAGGSDPSPE